MTGSLSQFQTPLHERAEASHAGAESDLRHRWLKAFRAVRAETDKRAAALSPEDQVIQSMPDASPTKWHRAHTTWFFEQFVLIPNVPSYKPFDERFAFLFNSYYVSAGPRHERPRRGLITRPGAYEVTAYRAHVDAAVEGFLRQASAEEMRRLAPVLEIGLNHEQQHQELIITDILHAFAHNPTDPAYDPDWRMPKVAGSAGYTDLPAGINRIGHTGAGFSFDNEHPSHDVLLHPARISRALVTNAQWLEFMAADGYETPTLWLSDGWATAQAEGWDAPGYWRQHGGGWESMTLCGSRPIDPAAPVCHVNYYEADAFARWSGKHLPTEFEWEVAARENLLDDAFGIVWQWTRSAYSAYPGYSAVEGALGEYNGKFMINQMVLRGSSLATPDGHSRATYRNFFHPQHRFQFSGLRLIDYKNYR